MTDLTTPAVPDPRLAPDPYEALAADLAYSYRGVFSPETVAAEGWTSPAGRRQVVPVVVAVSEGGVRTVRPAHRRGSASHLVSALALADAVALVGEDVTTVAPGDLLPTRSLR